MTGPLAELVAVGCLLTGLYCLGGLHGIYLARTEKVRFQAWADRVHALHVKAQELEGGPLL